MQKGDTIFGSETSLAPQRFSQRVVAGDKKLITLVQPLQVDLVGYRIVLSGLPTIAITAGKDQIPHTVEVA